ncbi:MAG: prepilin-type N-terminal cleavage/methylation domain-containing protein, partial [Planctomycetia bacterium]|nr:prepilin-type N-terminal cleavage/methylation domain-containing protein [Planctomycetia bacterium]
MNRSISTPQRHRRPQRVSRRRCSGFTLVELVIVILILGIASVIAVPRFVNTLNSSRARTAARRVANDVALVRSWARITSQSQSITFDTTGNT